MRRPGRSGGGGKAAETEEGRLETGERETRWRGWVEMVEEEKMEGAWRCGGGDATAAAVVVVMLVVVVRGLQRGCN